MRRAHWTLYSLHMNEIGQWIQLGFEVVLMTTFAFSMLYYLLTLGALLLRRRRRRALPPDTAPLPRVTVQIPTYNELAALRCAERCLAISSAVCSSIW